MKHCHFSLLHMQHALGSSGLCTTDLFNRSRFISAKEICSTAAAADRLWHQLEAKAPKGRRICLWDEPQLFAVFPCPSNYFNRKNSWRVIWLHMVHVMFTVTSSGIRRENLCRQFCSCKAFFLKSSRLNAAACSHTRKYLLPWVAQEMIGKLVHLHNLHYHQVVYQHR